METITTNIYQEMRDKIHGNRTTKKVGNNTSMEVRDPETVALRLHSTDIVTFKSDGSITLNAGGWRTATTKARINEWLPRGWSISQDKGVWYIAKFDSTWEIKGKYADGMTIHADDTMTGYEPIDAKQNSKDSKLKRRIKKYCVAFVAALEKGQIEDNTAGDCFYCQMREVNSKQPLGEIAKSDHLDQHLKENYFVLSLLIRAFETMPVSIAMKSFVGSALQKRTENVWAQDFIRAQVIKTLYRYISRQYGYAV